MNAIRTLPRKQIISPVSFIATRRTSHLSESVSLINDLLWSDPSDDTNTQTKLFVQSPRGLGNIFSPEATQMWLKANGFTHIVRAHQEVMNGIFCQHSGNVVTVFSASHYCGGENKGGFLEVNPDGTMENVVWEVKMTMDRFGKKVQFMPHYFT